MTGHTDVEVLGRAIARRGNRFQVHWLTCWGYPREPRASYGRVLWKGGRPVSAHRFAIQLADGRAVVGPVQGCGGVVERRGGFGRIRVAIVNAEEGLPTGLYEPRPGYARVYPDYSAQGQGEPVDVDLRGAEVLS